MEERYDLLEYLGADTSASIFMRLDHPEDIMHVCSVSRSWRHFVIANSLSKKLCLRLSPEVSKFIHIKETNISSEAMVSKPSIIISQNSLTFDHKVYMYLSRFLVSNMPKRNCISKAVCASSTDRYPDEQIENTLVANGTNFWSQSYWSSKGEIDPQIPETLTYRLSSRLCLVDEIKIQPFEVSFHFGSPVYSAETVRIKMGYSKNAHKKAVDDYHDDDYVWLYVSPAYPMVQDNVLQSFKLPRPVFCIGGIVQIELSGRVQKCYIDNLYYIGISYVQVMGLPLSPVIDADALSGCEGL